MKELLIKAAALVLMIGTSVVPPWDMPENAVAGFESQAVEQVQEAEEETADSGENGPYRYIGTFEATAYEWTGQPCANGNYPTEGYTIACNSLPLGTVVYIEGLGERVVEDRGADWHGDDWLDIYLGDEAACFEWGVRAVEVYIVE